MGKIGKYIHPSPDLHSPRCPPSCGPACHVSRRPVRCLEGTLQWEGQKEGGEQQVVWTTPTLGKLAGGGHCYQDREENAGGTEGWTAPEVTRPGRSVGWEMDRPVAALSPRDLPPLTNCLNGEVEGQFWGQGSLGGPTQVHRPYIACSGERARQSVPAVAKAEPMRGPRQRRDLRSKQTRTVSLSI